MKNHPTTPIHHISSEPASGASEFIDVDFNGLDEEQELDDDGERCQWIRRKMKMTE